MKSLEKKQTLLGLLLAVAVLPRCGDEHPSRELDFPQIQRFIAKPLVDLGVVPFLSQDGQSSLHLQNIVGLATSEKMSLVGDEEMVEKTFSIDGIKVHGTQLKEFSSGWKTGSVPQVLLNGELITPVTVGQFTLSETTALNYGANILNFHPSRFKFSEKVYYPSLRVLVPAYVFTVSASSNTLGRGPSVPLKIVVNADDGSILSQSPLAFHATATAHIFKENKIASAAEGEVDVTLDNLSSAEKLENEIIKVVNCRTELPSAGCIQTTGTGGDFTSIPWGNEAYDEIISYYAIMRASSWHRKIMNWDSNSGTAKWGNSRLNFGLSSTNRLTVYSRAKTMSAAGSGTLDNAQYLPAGSSGEGTPEIVIGTGWETGQGPERHLRYLGKDADVSMHEFGHHIVFRSIQDTGGESGAMHEGLADYFTYAITGNNKLAESITKTGAPLREGNVQGNISEYITANAHIAGQFFSSTLWDVRAALGTWQEGVEKSDKIIWDAVDYVPYNSSYYQFIAAMAKTTDNFAAANGGDAVSLKEKMFNVFHSRGFLEAPTGNGVLPKASSTIASTTLKKSSKSKESSSWWQFCGAISSDAEKRGASWVALLIMLLPLGAVHSVKTMKRIPIRVKKN